MTHKPNISKNERSAASNRWRHAANIKHGLAIIAFVACILPASNLCGQNIAIKSNLLYDLTTTLNMGGEVRCDRYAYHQPFPQLQPLELRREQKDEAFPVAARIP